MDWTVAATRAPSTKSIGFSVRLERMLDLLPVSLSFRRESKDDY